MMGRDLVTVTQMIQKFGNQSYPATYAMQFVSVGVNNAFFNWSPVASDYWFQVVSKNKSKSGLVG